MEIKIERILGAKSAKIAKILVQKEQIISENQIVAYLETKKKAICPLNQLLVLKSPKFINPKVMKFMSVM